MYIKSKIPSLCSICHSPTAPYPVENETAPTGWNKGSVHAMKLCWYKSPLPTWMVPSSQDTQNLRNSLQLNMLGVFTVCTVCENV